MSKFLSFLVENEIQKPMIIQMFVFILILVSLIIFLCLNHLAFDMNGFKTGNQFLHKDGYCFSTDDIRVSG